MAESKEYSTIVKCSRDLEIVLEESNKDIAKFLFQQGFISKERHDEVINPKSLLTGADKASMLVTTIRNRVELNPRNYHKVVDYMRQNIIFRDVVAILDAEYQGSTPPAQSLTEEHHFEVFSHLNKLSKEELVRVGTALGLLFRNCTDMSKDQIVTAWLKGNDNVVKDERDSRTWDALITALKKCGNNGIAKDVQEYIQKKTTEAN